MSLFRLVISIVLSITLSSCNSNEYSKDTRDFKKEIKRLHGTRLLFPEELLMLRNESITPVLSSELFNFPLKIVTIISGDCGNCVLKINGWTRITRELKHNKKVKVYIIIMADSDFFVESYSESILIDYPLLFDESFYMLINNELSERIELRTFLLDESNNIILVGNPILGSSIENMYLNTIENY